jgi:hypothetical protein
MRSSTAIVGGLALACLASGAIRAQQFVQETSTRFPVPNPAEYTNQLTIGDIDGDGDLDILFANGQGFSGAGAALKARIFINDGTGVFTDQTDPRTGGLAGWYRGVALGDCDRDGDLDAVLAQDFSKVPQLLINGGSGFFANETGTRLPNLTLSSSRGQFGDVDNDGDLDLFFTNGTTSKFGCGQYRLYLNDGACHYTDVTPAQFPIANVCENQDAIFGDIDNDFDLDIRTASTGTNNSRLYRNNGAGVFSLVSGVPNDEGCYSYDFGDIDGDGDLDLLGVNGSATSSAELLLKNDGNGGYTNVSSQISPNPNEDDNDSKFFDYDVDGDLDLLIGRLGGAGEKIYRNSGAGAFTQITGQITAINDSTLDLGVGDLNGDGALDIVTAQGESGNFENRIYINQGPPDTLAPRIIKTESLPTPPATGPYTVRALILDDMTSDRSFFDHGIDLHYTVDAGATQTVPMLHSGGQVYRGRIPNQPGQATIQYWVEARDFNDNAGVGASQSFVTALCAGVNACSGHGSCVGTDTCECNSGWEGADCATAAAIPAGRVPDSGAPSLKLRKGPNSVLLLSWGASCGPDDVDYEVYQGAVDDWTSHAPLYCTTGGNKFKTFTVAAGDLYFLVVPASLSREGSYGTDSTGAERPPSAVACRAQSILACP